MNRVVYGLVYVNSVYNNVYNMGLRNVQGRKLSLHYLLI